MKASKRTIRAASRRRADNNGKQVTVELCNPVAEHFPAFIIGNALVWQVRALLDMQSEMEPEAYTALVEEFQRYKAGTAYASSPVFHDALAGVAERYVVQAGESVGKTVAICGAGPTLRDHAADYCQKVDHVFGCNSAVTWLHNQGHRVTHGFTVDQTAHMAEEWAAAPDVDYLVASTVHPDLMDTLVGAGRRFRFFHNFVGIRERPVCWAGDDGVERTMSYEDWLYTANFPMTVLSGSGLNTVTRAIDIAQYMGYSKIYVLGADCALQYHGTIPDGGYQQAAYIQWLRENTVMHADGGHALASDATPITLQGEIDGRVWLTKPDMAISAQWLIRVAEKSGGQVELVGDTLPNAIANAKHVKRNIKDRDGRVIRTEVIEVDPTDHTWMPNFVDADGNLANLPS